MGANPLPGIDTERRDLKSAIYADCAIVRREEGVGRAGPTHLIPRRGNFGLSEDGDEDGDGDGDD